MREFVVVFAMLVLFAVSAFGSTPEDTNSVSNDKSYNKMIVGKWAEEGERYGIASFKEGGVYEAWMYDSPKKEKLLYTIKGTWWIKDGKLYNTATEITPPMPDFDSSRVVVDRIVEITEDSMTLIDEELNQYTNKRIKNDADGVNLQPKIETDQFTWRSTTRQGQPDRTSGHV